MRYQASPRQVYLFRREAVL